MHKATVRDHSSPLFLENSIQILPKTQFILPKTQFVLTKTPSILKKNSINFCKNAIWIYLGQVTGLKNRARMIPAHK